MRLLTLGTYPFINPRHGGQLRLDALHRQMRDAGWLTDHLAVSPRDAYPGAADDADVIELSMAFSRQLAAERKRTDVHASDYLLANERAFKQFAAKIDEFSPDVISLEQPWLWPALKHYFAGNDARDHTVMVYSSQNVEAALIADEQRDNKLFEGSEADAALAIEIDLATHADGVIAVSGTDAVVFAQHNDHVHVAPNGISPMSRPTGLGYWQDRLRGLSSAIFAGSAHGPNATGFVSCLLVPALAYLAPDCNITVVGRVGDLLLADRQFRQHYGTNLARMTLAGVQDPGGLSTLFHLASVVLLPLTTGGGTNIKTAEALFSRKPIIATRTALRGFEAYLDMPHLRIAEPGPPFARAVAEELQAHRTVEFTDEELGRLDNLLWERTLAGIPQWLADLGAGKPVKAGQSRWLGVKSGLRQILQDSWHGVEPLGVWSHGRAATLRLPKALAGESAQKASFDITGFLGDEDHVFVGVRVGTEIRAHSALVRGRERQIIEVPVRPEDWAEDGFLNVAILASHVLSPGGGDDRQLSVMLHRVAVS